MCVCVCVHTHTYTPALFIVFTLFLVWFAVSCAGKFPGEDTSTVLEKAKKQLCEEHSVQMKVFDDALIHTIAAQVRTYRDTSILYTDIYMHTFLPTGWRLLSHRVWTNLFSLDIFLTWWTQADADLSAVCSVAGGIIADQVVKCVSCKEHPLCNYFFFDARASAGFVYKLSSWWKQQFFQEFWLSSIHMIVFVGESNLSNVLLRASRLSCLFQFFPSSNKIVTNCIHGVLACPLSLESLHCTECW